TATSTLDAAIVSDSKAVIVPPVKQFLDVTVTSDRDPVLPGSKSRLHVVTKSFDGEPVATEIALPLLDEPLPSSQADYAQDVRQFFYGEKKGWNVRTSTSVDRRPYKRWRVDDKGRVMLAEADGSVRDEEEQRFNEKARRGRGDRSEGKDDFALGRL